MKTITKISLTLFLGTFAALMFLATLAGVLVTAAGLATSVVSLAMPSADGMSNLTALAGIGMATVGYVTIRVSTWIGHRALTALI